jgi:signal transduction histidine kinase/response regulator RpfG family c-di-GMP phosphodiesterase
MSSTPSYGSVEEVLRGGGAMGVLMRSIDWRQTAVGAVDTWPQSLRTALSILLETGFPMYIAWGPNFTQFYNDGYRPILGSTKHPSAMGASTRQTFSEIWDIIGPMFDGVMRGTPTTFVDFLLPLDRHGFAEECYFIFSYSPIRQEDGSVGGVLVTVTETTPRVLGERRLKATQALAARTRDAKTVREACAISAEVLCEHTADIPWALLYLVATDGTDAVLEQTCGLPPAHSLAVPRISVTDASPWPLERVLQSGVPQVVDLDPEAIIGGDRITRAFVLPIVPHGEGAPVGVLVTGLSPRLMLDQAYRDFIGMVASQIGTAIASARALQEAKARAEALAELDRAKTAFFSNVSHEFRTPLTLLLGPTEEAAGSGGRLEGEDLQAVYRNAQRLLKLVNTLLDFSRIEAGRAEAVFAPTDLSALTADLASAFRSATERAGIALVVTCPPLPEPVYVDREMWEKVVLNLLSNAFKFTFDGRIGVTLSWRGSHVELAVSDTGVGIPPEHLPHVFDRFHRVEHTRGRTHEGSGIGLALVRELVTMHGGTVAVHSEAGEGTTFVVTIPAGSGHLPAERLGAVRAAAMTATATPYVQEALRWLPAPAGAGAAEIVPASPADVVARVLVADDNADLREYIARILGERWSVETVADGILALAAARRDRPDVIISDVMMPELDGFGLLQALRDDDRTRSVPVILLSARAGAEARVEGLQAGADDYMVKPFSARELVARVQAQVLRARVRSVEEAHARRLAGIFAHAPVGVALLRGPEHLFEFANPPYLELVGRRSIVGKPIREALPELAGQGIYELLTSVYATGQPHVGRAVRVAIDRGASAPTEAFFDFVYQPLVENGTVTGIAVVCFEVSDLVRARGDAEAANRAKDEFLAMLGHELRNPLAPILTALQLMRLRGVAGGERERGIIERQVKHVVGLVDDLLDVSRITRGKVHLRIEPVDLADVVTKAIEMTGPAIEAGHHTLTVDVRPGMQVDGDPARLAQVVANLLTNAAKYTEPHGRIRVVSEREGARVMLRVSDNGRGIPAEMLPRVFDLFVQERQELERAQGGLGIGLAIVRSLVQAHGGTVDARSEGTGHGSTFTVAFPAAGTQTAVLPVAQAPDSRQLVGGSRILVVDDNRDAAQMLADSLQSLGHTVVVAHDGPSALAIAATFRPEVALLDLGLPVMDGFELGLRLRTDLALTDLVLMAVTGYAQEADRQRTMAAGFQGHLVKPVDVLHVNAIVRELIATSGARRAATPDGSDV